MSLPYSAIPEARWEDWNLKSKLKTNHLGIICYITLQSSCYVRQTTHLNSVNCIPIEGCCCIVPHHLSQPVWMWGSRCLSQQHATSTDSHCQPKWHSVAWASMVCNCFSPLWEWPLCWWYLESNQEDVRFPCLPQRHGERRDIESLCEGALSARADTGTGGKCWNFREKICSQGRNRWDCNHYISASMTRCLAHTSNTKLLACKRLCL